MNRKKSLRKLYCFIVIIFFTTCKKDHLLDCFTSTGKIASVESTVPLFDRIEMYDNVDLIFRQDSISKIKITAGANLLDGITAEVSNNRLIIKNGNRCNWTRDYKNTFTVEASSPALLQITNNGSGNIEFADTLHSPEFQYDNVTASGDIKLVINTHIIKVNIHTGVADVTASGRADVTQLYYNGYGYMNFKKLVNDLTYITNKGTGNCAITVAKELDAKILYSGNIFYSGNPLKVLSEIKGSGKLIHEN